MLARNKKGRPEPPSDTEVCLFLEEVPGTDSDCVQRSLLARYYLWDCCCAPLVVCIFRTDVSIFKTKSHGRVHIV